MTNDLTKLITFLNEQKRLRAEAESGFVIADGETWPGNENLQHWVKSNRDDETHTHGDGIGCFIKYEDARFFEHAHANYTTIIDMLLNSLEALQDTVDSGYDQANHCQNTINELCDLGSGK